MKTIQLASITALLGSMATLCLGAAPFDSGSSGAYGALNVTANTNLDTPADGIFHCTTITISAGATVRFNSNSLNTPIYLLATGDVLINGTIDVSGTNATGALPGRGGPGGFDGGYGGFGVGGKGGDGTGPGGGVNVGGVGGARGGVYATTVSGNAKLYGNVLINPLLGGSGGSGSDGNPGQGGCGGGGAVLLASNTRITVNGTIRAAGAYVTGTASGGSGGAIRVVAPVVDGTGTLTAPFTNLGGGNNGGDGRIRIDCTDRVAFRSLHVNTAFTRGSQMFVFSPVPVPRLDIIEAAGQMIPEGTANGVQIDLPVGSPTNQTVKVQARDFTNNVAVAVAVTPDDRASITYSNIIDISGGNPAQVTVNVVIPAGTSSRIHAWTR